MLVVAVDIVAAEVVVLLLMMMGKYFNILF